MGTWLLRDADIHQLAVCKVGANRQRVFLLKSGEDERKVALLAPLYKSAGADWRTAYVPVAVPGEPENQGIFGTDEGDTDVWEPDEIRRAAHSYLANGGRVVAKHFDGQVAPGITVAESAVALSDFKVGEHTISEGTWYVGLNVEGDARELVSKGEIDAVSVEGIATRVAKDAALVPNKPGVTNWVQRAGGLPKKIADLAGDLISEQGFTTSHAVATAVNDARKSCAKGKPEWCAAVAEWEAKKASAGVAKDGELIAKIVGSDSLEEVEDDDRNLLQRVAKAIGIPTDADLCGLDCGCYLEVDESLDDTPEAIAKATLSTGARKRLPPSAFVYPKKAPGGGSYPIHDRAHAANALARSSGKPQHAAVRAAVCKRHPDMPACKKMAKDDGALPGDSGSLGDVEIGERVEKLEQRLDGLDKRLIGTDEEPGLVAKIATDLGKLAKETPEPKPDDGDDGSSDDDAAEGKKGKVAKTEPLTREQLDKQLEKVAEEFAGKMEPIAKAIDELSEGRSSEQDDNADTKNGKVAKESQFAGILFD